MLNVLAARTMAALATYVPFRDFLCMNVVANGMATIAGGAGRAAHVIRRVECRPPIACVGDEIPAPYVILNFPLRGQGKIVVADFRKVALFPNAAIDKSDLVFCKLRN